MILDKIVQVKLAEIARDKENLPITELQEQAAMSRSSRDFFQALAAGDGVKVIAEVKKASPSKGLIRPDFDHLSLARDYLRGGAAALSVLTDQEFFQGSLDYLRDISCQLPLPVLRKDFILDPYQVYQARAAGADALLLIARILEPGLLAELIALTGELGMDALVEVHTEEDVAKGLAAGAKILGINNRDLATFTTDLGVTLRLAPQVPDGCLIVSESGVNTPEDLQLLARAGVRAVLVGEALARERDAAAATARLTGKEEAYDKG